MPRLADPVARDQPGRSLALSFFLVGAGPLRASARSSFRMRSPEGSLGGCELDNGERGRPLRDGSGGVTHVQFDLCPAAVWPGCAGRPSKAEPGSSRASGAAGARLHLRTTQFGNAQPAHQLASGDDRPTDHEAAKDRRRR